MRFLACAGEMSRRRIDMEPFACQLLTAVSMLRGHVLSGNDCLSARDFQGIPAEVEEAVRRTLEEAPEDAAELADLGLRRPSSTWTYMVTDNPFGSEADRIVEFLGRAVRGGRPPAVTYV